MVRLKNVSDPKPDNTADLFCSFSHMYFASQFDQRKLKNGARKAGDYSDIKIRPDTEYNQVKA